MEEVPAYVHPGPINPNILTRQHEHRSGLIWSGDHETCHMLSDMSSSLIHTSILHEVDDMTTGVLVGLPLSRFGILGRPGARRGHAHSPLNPGGRGRTDPRYREERRRGSGGRGRADPSSYVLPDPYDSLGRDALTFNLGLTLVALSHPSGASTSYPPSSVRDKSYSSPPSSAVGLSFDAPPPLGTSGSSVSHMPISRASSSDSDEHGDEPVNDVTPAQQLGFRHRVGKKTT
ncbi:hypothetical protein M9H77_09512 [Catharanthus roseus]|uniref:Uncharacterized protein n=1 Tax=Catharanthus roseus TaxID=4058 RepID=A0ACC0C0T1_CATRO|nr:hypothetical protein M9H77_09512 [Catharanthus roseus]